MKMISRPETSRDHELNVLDCFKTYNISIEGGAKGESNE